MKQKEYWCLKEFSDQFKATYRLSLWPQRSSSSLWSRWATGAGESRSSSNTSGTLQATKRKNNILVSSKTKEDPKKCGSRCWTYSRSLGSRNTISTRVTLYRKEKTIHQTVDRSVTYCRSERTMRLLLSGLVKMLKNEPMLLQAPEILEFQPLHGVPVLPQIHELQWDQLLPIRTQQQSLST